MDGTEFCLLGPVGIWQDERLLGPTAAQQRSVLAMLLMASGRVVSVDRLVLAVWGEDPPGSARNAVQVQISKLRRILSPLPGTELATSAKGYSLAVAREQVDLHRFRDLVRAAREAGAPEGAETAETAETAEAVEARAGKLLRAALQLWRGPALADVSGGWLPETLGAGLEEERRAAVEECAAIDLRSGRHHEAAAELSALVAEHPLRERSVALLMEALRRCGRRADALALFRSTRRRYVEELGIEPGDELQRLHRQALDDSRDGRRDWGARDPRDARDPRADRDRQDARDPRAHRDRQDGWDRRGDQDGLVSRGHRVGRGERDGRDGRDSRDARSGRDSRDTRERRDNLDARDNPDGRGSRDGRGHWDGRDGQDGQGSLGDGDGRDGRDSRGDQDGRGGWDGRDRQGDQDGRDSRDGQGDRAGRGSQGRRDSQDIRDGRDSRGSRGVAYQRSDPGGRFDRGEGRYRGLGAFGGVSGAVSADVALASEPGPEGAGASDEVHDEVPEAAEPSGIPAPAPEQITVVTAVPQQLPSDVAHFTGRERELAGLDALLEGGAGGRAATAARITVIAGSGGLGKTTLAVHWAHRVRDRFPDGQLYVNLRGFGPTDSAMTTAEAVRGFLDAFQVPADRIPATIEAQTALYRSLLADRRMLILLDNARDAEQVRPLLPGSPGCLVVLTSRNELTSLVVAEQAQPLPLDLLDRGEAREVLISRVGTERVVAEPKAVGEVITVCAGLPLALAIVAARAATHPRFGLGALAGELRAARGSLDAFEGGDATTDVRAVFSWSYHALDADTARLFRLLGVHPGPDIAAPAAASLVGIPVPQARRLLIQLTRAHLITERAPGQYGFHDLLRAYAVELTLAYDAQEDRRAALHRLLDHYLHTAVAAGKAFTPNREPITIGPVRRGVDVGEFPGHGQALLWFIRTCPALMAALQEAAEAGFETHAWQLAWSLTEFLDQRGHWHDQRTAHRIALGSAHRVRDLTGQAHSCYALGLADLRMGRYDRARGHLGRALNLHREVGNTIGQALAHGALNLASEREGRHDEGLHHALRALKLYRAAGHRGGEAYALNNVGWAYAMMGDFQQTLVHCEKALTMLRQSGDRRGESAAWDSLGYAHQHVGDHQQAISCYRHAVDLRRGRGERVREAESLHRLGSAQLAAGDRAGARRSWQRALTRFDSLGHPDAHRVRDGLTGLGGSDG
ncbi:BTAD domain-containing putative transcriptional regulator [Streptomyces sp. HNM1019]|uniref:AfsR/SARP family transcriptional regulator n=1 Tax=Streptomyces sp. HNM1019 TaxID=3424717 RepID=UPI003D76F35B